MKILYISSLIFRKASSASIRNVGLIEGLIKTGHHVDVLTIEYPPTTIDDYLFNKISSEIHLYTSRDATLYNYLITTNRENTDSQNQKKNNILIQYAKKFYKKVLSFPDVDAGWLRNIPDSIYENKYDLIISSSDTKTSHFVAQKIIKKFKYTTWAQIWGDPWATDVNLTNQENKRIEKNEKKILYEADKIYYVSEPTMNEMKDKFPEYSHKMSFIGRSYLEGVNGDEIGTSDKWRFLYTGNITNYRNLDNLLNAILEYNETNNKSIQLTIFGIVSEKVKENMKKFDFIIINNPIPFSQVLEKYKSTDALIYVDNGSKSSQIPGKIYDYFGTDRPIIAIVDDLELPTTKFISRFNRAIILKNNQDLTIPDLAGLSKQIQLTQFSTSCLAEKLINEL